MADRRLFTLEEANAVLPALQPVLEALRSAVLEAQRHQANLEQMQKVYPSANGHRAELETQIRLSKDALDELMVKIRALIAEAEGLGCEVKDPSSGLIDFRSLRDGEVVYLCWRLGEGDHIEFWHTLTDGFAGRRPL